MTIGIIQLDFPLDALKIKSNTSITTKKIVALYYN